MTIYRLPSGAMATTAAVVQIATGTAIKTLLQVKMGANTNETARVVAWGISFDGSAAATPIKCELLTTGAIGATITEFVAADIINLDDPNAPAVTDDQPFAFTAAGDESGYNASAEGSIVATRNFDLQFVAPSVQWAYQWPLGREPRFKASEFLRVRVTAGASVNAYCWVDIDV